MSLLVDTNLWVDHFRRAQPILLAELRAGNVVTHPAVIGELVLGGLSPARCRLLRWLPQVRALPDDDVLAFVEWAPVVRTGIGWVDCHLLASVAASPPRCRLWTRDKKLASCATRLRRNYDGPV